MGGARPAHVFLVGPTGAGKSALALRLAEQLGLEIAAVDAFQVYRGMDIGTAKPSAAERTRIRHHLMDLVEPWESFTAGRYLELGAALVAALQTRGQSSIWVGGTGLYVRVMRSGLAAAPPTDSRLRAELEKLPLAQLQAEVKQADPAWAARADLQNPVRVIRALAVWRQTGRPLSVWQQEGGVGPLSQAPILALVPKREQLRRRVEERFEAMWSSGWPDEVAGLLQIPGWITSGSARAIGYRAVAAVVQGKMTRADCRHQVVTETMAYAKRQLTWLRRERNLLTIETDGSKLDEQSLAGWWKRARGDSLS